MRCHRGIRCTSCCARRTAAHVPTHTLQLNDLALSDVRSLVADTLHVPAAEAAELAALVHAKTRGNPFFVRRFIQSLDDDGHLRFDKDTLRWRWDVARSRRSTSPTTSSSSWQRSSIVFPRTRALRCRRPPCIGGRFDLSILSAATGRSRRICGARCGRRERRLPHPRDRAARLDTGDGDGDDDGREVRRSGATRSCTTACVRRPTTRSTQTCERRRASRNRAIAARAHATEPARRTRYSRS